MEGSSITVCGYTPSSSSNSNSIPPDLEAISEGDDSGLDDSMSSKSSQGSSASNCSRDLVGGGGSNSSTSRFSSSSSLSSGGNIVKKVRWDRIHTREYALVVGDHPLCQDGLPVSLDWHYNDNATPAIDLVLQQQQQQCHDRQQLQQQAQHVLPQQNDPIAACRSAAYVFPRRLSYEERRDRLQKVSNLTLDQIKNDEIDLVVRTLNETFFDTTESSFSGEVAAAMSPLFPSTNIPPPIDLDGDVIMFDDDTTDYCNKNETMEQLLLFPGDGNDDDDDDDDDLFDMSNFDWGVESERGKV